MAFSCLDSAVLKAPSFPELPWPSEQPPLGSLPPTHSLGKLKPCLKSGVSALCSLSSPAFAS